MSWNCVECTRYWGRVHSQCPLCQSRWSTRMALLRVIPDPMSRRSILAYLGMRPRVRPLWKGYSLCSVGTPYNCRCERCRAPIAGNQAAWNLLARLSRKHGRGRAKAARWMYLLSGLLSPTTPSSTTPQRGLRGDVYGSRHCTGATCPVHKREFTCPVLHVGGGAHASSQTWQVEMGGRHLPPVCERARRLSRPLWITSAARARE